jgi:hypothetical protein
MVVWLFAGGGETEVRGLVPFFRKNFPHCRFDRKTPVSRKPGPRPGVKISGYGRTGKSLVSEIKARLKTALSKGDVCDVILIFDDLDCRDSREQEEKFINAADSVDGAKEIPKIVGFAAPEMESWIVADWDHSIGRHVDFRANRRHERMRHWLSHDRNVPFHAPESFGTYDARRDSCDEKISKLIIESSMRAKEDGTLPCYAKGRHTPILLLDLDCHVVKQKCPIFRELHNSLSEYCLMEDD